MERKTTDIGTARYSALDVAEAIIRYCFDRRMAMSNLKLQKILYLCQAEYLVEHSRPLFYEKIVAWAYGPVVPEVYSRYRIYGIGCIPVSFDERPHVLDDEDLEEVGEMAMYCAKYTVNTLVTASRNQRPWQEAYVPGESREISKAAIWSYFA